MKETAVAIVGGGPAGLATAIHLAGAGISTILFEKRPYPVDKPCGEGIMPPGVARLRGLGIDTCAGYPFVGIRYYGGPGLAAVATFPSGPGRGMRRTTLSTLLRRRAEQLPALTLHSGCHARPVGRHSGRIFLEAGGERFSARLLVGADGLNSLVRRWAGLQAAPPHWLRWGARRHFRITPWSNFVDVHWNASGIEAYVTPTGPDEVGVAFLWHKNRFHTLQGGDDFFASLLAPFPQLQTRLAAAVPLDEAAAIGPLHRPVPDVVADGVLLIGDAAGYLDAITGEGISLALAQAEALARTVLPLLRHPGPLPTAALAPYRRHYRRLSRAYVRFTRLALFLSDHPRIVPPMLRVLRSWPRLFQAVLSAGIGSHPPA